MGKFRTDDDDYGYPPMDDNYYPPDNPEMGGYPEYGHIKKPGILSRILGALGNIGSGSGLGSAGMGSGITAEKVFFVIYLIAMLLIVINFKTVMDFMFFVTMSILQYVIMVAVVILLIYIFCRFVLHMR